MECWNPKADSMPGSLTHGGCGASTTQRTILLQLGTGIPSCAGEFAEACRDQFMSEREEYFAELEQKVPSLPLGWF